MLQRSLRRHEPQMRATSHQVLHPFVQRLQSYADHSVCIRSMTITMEQLHGELAMVCKTYNFISIQDNVGKTKIRVML